MKNKAIFFDKDNTLIKDRVYNPEFNPDYFFPETLSALQKIAKRDYFLFILSNQSGIGRGYFPRDQYRKEMGKMILFLKMNGINIINHFYCPHMPEDGCLCRKPGIGMIKKAQAYYNLDLGVSWLIGDRMADIQAGINAGLKTLYIYRGYPETEDENNRKKERHDHPSHYHISEKYLKKNHVSLIHSLTEVETFI